MTAKRNKVGRQSKLTAKQERFVEEYLVELNATRAAIRAGYSENTAAAVGCDNSRWRERWPKNLTL